jgi:hypothetical protein
LGPTPPDRVTPPLAGGDDVVGCASDVGAAGTDDGWLVPVDGALALAPDDDGAAPATPAPDDEGAAPATTAAEVPGC